MNERVFVYYYRLVKQSPVFKDKDEEYQQRVAYLLMEHHLKQMEADRANRNTGM